MTDGIEHTWHQAMEISAGNIIEGQLRQSPSTPYQYQWFCLKENRTSAQF
jgi:hypothetical protein